MGWDGSDLVPWCFMEHEEHLGSLGHKCSWSVCPQITAFVLSTGTVGLSQKLGFSV